MNSDSNKSTQIRFDTGETATIQGDLTLDTVGRIFRQTQHGFSGGSRPFTAVDLAGVSRVDSSSLALLLEWQSAFGQSGARLRVRNAPRDLLRLAKLCSAEDLLELDVRQPANEGA